MALSRTNLVGQISGASGSFGTGAFTTGSFTPPNSSLIVAGVEAIENGSSGALLANMTIADSVGLTWTSRVSQDVSPSSFPTAVVIWTAPVTSGVSMTITLDAGALSIGEYAISAVAYTGYNTGTPTGATATGSQNGGFTTPPDPVDITLSASPASTSEVFAIVGIDKSVAGVTPGSGWTEIDDLHNSDWGGAQSQIRTGSTSTNVHWDDLRPGGGALFNYAAAALEILEAAAGAGFVAPSILVVPPAAVTRASTW